MLYDRFDDMRSKNSGGGDSPTGELYDLSKIGTKISAIPTTSMRKGSLWKGTKNPNVGYNLLYELLNNLPTEYIRTSKDYRIGFYPTSPTINSSTTDFTFYLLKNKSYIPLTVNIGAQIQALELTTLESQSISYQTKFNFSENGNLAFLNVVASNNTVQFGGRNKVIVIEIDKENESANAYIATCYDITTGGYGTSFQIFGNYILQHRYINNQSSAWSYKYNYETHNFDFLASNSTLGNTTFQNLFGISSQFGFEKIAWIDEKTVIFHPSFDNSSYAKRLCKIEFGSNSLNAISSSFTTTYSSLKVNMSGDGKYVSNILSGGNYEIGVINQLDLSVTFFTPTTIIQGSSGLKISNNKILAGNSTSLYLYEIVNQNVNLLYTFTFPRSLDNFGSTSNDTTPFFDFENITSYKNYLTSYLFRALIQNGEYVIEASNGGLIENNKYYGIVSSDLTFGNTGIVQLLWNSIQ